MTERLGALELIELGLDDGSFVRWDGGLVDVAVLGWPATAGWAGNF